MYVNQASTLIKNWLLKNGCKLNNEATTSESKYYNYGDTKIRVSCHMPNSCSSNSIYILIPVNDKYSFGVFIGKQFCPVSSIKELKTFLKSIFLVLDVKAFNELSKSKVQLTISDSDKDKKIKELETKIGNLKIQLKDQKKKIDNQATQLRILQTKK